MPVLRVIHHSGAANSHNTIRQMRSEIGPTETVDSLNEILDTYEQLKHEFKGLSHSQIL